MIVNRKWQDYVFIKCYVMHMCVSLYLLGFIWMALDSFVWLYTHSNLQFLPDASFGLRILPLPVSVCLCVVSICLSVCMSVCPSTFPLSQMRGPRNIVCIILEIPRPVLRPSVFNNNQFKMNIVHSTLTISSSSPMIHRLSELSSFEPPQLGELKY